MAGLFDDDDEPPELLKPPKPVQLVLFEDMKPIQTPIDLILCEEHWADHPQGWLGGPCIRWIGGEKGGMCRKPATMMCRKTGLWMCDECRIDIGKRNPLLAPLDQWTATDKGKPPYDKLYLDMLRPEEKEKAPR